MSGVADAGALHRLSATELAAGIREREFSAVEVLTDHLDRIEEVDPRVVAKVSPHPRRRPLAEVDALVLPATPVTAPPAVDRGVTLPGRCAAAEGGTPSAQAAGSNVGSTYDTFGS
ncbi:hypothetical protein VD659_10850 [Herbiconiux sp. 11R-BC]|uniref:hypothetical protein n=1 Tax=Herbiconiux sp. 11R-BC TaxID=3111637 RepID=UPI003C011A3B